MLRILEKNVRFSLDLEMRDKEVESGTRNAGRDAEINSA